MQDFDFSKVHFNVGLLVKELIKRGVQVKLIEGTDVIIADYFGHREVIQNENTSAIPYTVKFSMDNKYLTKLLLKDLDISVSNGNKFKKNELGKALLFANKIGFPIVIKPTIGSHGEYVHMDLNTLEEVEYAFNQVADTIGNDPFTDILVEKQFMNGREYRIFISKNDFIAGVEREPANVIGNGVDSIQMLIDNENYRRMNPRNSCLCEIRTKDDVFEKFIKDNNISLDYIPKKGEKVYLRPNSNVSTGANCRNITDTIHPSVLEIARKIIKGINGLPYVGIDFLSSVGIDKYNGPEDYIICELNTTPGFSLHTHEETNTPINVPGEVVNIIFPETMETNFKRCNIIDKNYTFIKSLSSKFQKNYPENFFYKPVCVEIELTNKCNLKCNGCKIIEDIQNPNDRITVDDIINFLNKSKYKGVYSYSLTGGEPFLKINDIYSLIENVETADLFKIQSNGYVFSTMDKTLEVLNELKEKGFDKKNKYIKPGITCSFGMQTENGLNIDNICNFCYGVDKVFGNSIDVRLNLTYKTEEEIEYYIGLFETRYKELFGIKPDYSKIFINLIQLYPNSNIKYDESDNLVNIEELINYYNTAWDCFGKEYSHDTPLPRMLLRADGTMYACSCFGHVYKVGNILDSTFDEIIENLNTDNKFKGLVENGLKYIYDKVLEQDQSISDILLPSNSSVCDICGFLYNKLK